VRSIQNWVTKQIRIFLWRLLGLALSPMLFALVARPQTTPPPSDAAQNNEGTQKDLAKVSIEDLMNMEVTSVSKKEQKVSRTAAAVFVITREDIRRSGATNIPDLLRMVPGMNVFQINGNVWAVSARGFAAQFSNKLLVMVDGRSVYSPSFGGVLWDLTDVALENIERIEVIRGPGGTIWGANAVNGVINIITEKASQTQGGLVSAGGGTLQKEFGYVRYGGEIGKNTDYRFDAKYFDQSDFPSLDGQNGQDGWHALRGEFRLDDALTSKDALTFQGDMFTGREGETLDIVPSVTSTLQNVQFPGNMSGGYFRSTWDHAYSPGSDAILSISFDRYVQCYPVQTDTRNTFELDFQHRFGWGARQDVVWGLQYRYSPDHFVGSFAISFEPVDRTDQIFSTFIQDEIAIVPNRFYLTAGTKLEHNQYTGFEFLPSARATWEPTERQTFWTAVSVATRTPARDDADLQVPVATVPGQPPTVVIVFGNPKISNEGLTAYEAGWRTSLTERLSMDVAGYFNSYRKLETDEPGTPYLETVPDPPHIVVPLVFGNKMHGETHGLETFANWRATSRWTLSPGYVFEQIHMHLDPTSGDTTSVASTEGTNPVHSAQLRSHLRVLQNVSWDTSVYFTDHLVFGNVPAYTRVDSELTWQFTERASFSVAGQNLAKDHPVEFFDPAAYAQTNQIKRSAYAKLTWHF
jgi:iron complex outermembrane recepter protein